MNNNSPSYTPRIFSRDQYFRVVRAALQAELYRFAREALLNWLSIYPGDLGASFYYARTLLGEGHTQQALPVLEGLSAADPEFLEVAGAWLRITSRLIDASLSENQTSPDVSAQKFNAWRAYYYALSGRAPDDRTLPAWGKDLWFARQAVADGNLEEAQTRIREVLRVDPPTPLAALTHLQFLDASPEAPIKTRIELAERYHRRWPDCLVSSLFLAHWTLESGNTGEAVALLHQVASRDVGGQVVQRLWGLDHPYHDLWPGRLSCEMPMAVPAEIAGRLGWNRLAQAGDPVQMDEILTTADHQPDTAPLGALDGKAIPEDRSEDLLAKTPHAETSVDDFIAELESELSSGEPISQGVADQDGAPAPDVSQLVLDFPIPEPQPEIDFGDEQPELTTAGNGQKSAGRRKPHKKRILPKELQKIQQELERIAGRLNQPDITRMDGRFPIYVVFSVRSKLVSRYGEEAAAHLETEMNRLVEAIQESTRWGACLFFPDDPASTTTKGIRPARPDDPWELKLALADLDSSLASKGEMIGALAAYRWWP